MANTNVDIEHKLLQDMVHFYRAGIIQFLETFFNCNDLNHIFVANKRLHHFLATAFLKICTDGFYVIKQPVRIS